MKLEHTVLLRRTPVWAVTAAALLAGAASLPAQLDGPCTPAWTGGTTIPGTGLTRAGQRSLAFSASKVAGIQTTWCLVRHTNSGQIYLRRSKDCGLTWDTVRFGLPTPHEINASMVTGTDCRTLHVVWAGNIGGFASVYYCAFDAVSGTWLCTPTILAQGTSSNRWFTDPVIERTAKGRLVVAYTGAEPTPGFNGWYGSTIRVAQPPADGSCATGWSGGQPINTTPKTAIWPDLVAVGETVHISYRSEGPSNVSGIYYRGFNTESATFNTTFDVPIPNSKEAAMATSIAHDGDCAGCRSKLYVLFAAADSGSGELKLSCVQVSGADTWTNWTTSVVDSDPPLQSSKYYGTYSLATGENRRVYAMYSKWSDNHKKLYSSCYQGGISSGGPCTVSSGVTNQFRGVSALRRTQSMSHPYVAVFDPNQVTVFRKANVARTVAFGRYLGTKPETPRLDAVNTPTALTTFCVAICEVPPNQPGALCVGFDCIPGQPLPPPFETGTFQLQDWSICIPYTTLPCTGINANGYAQVCLSIPNLPCGQSVYMQAVQVFGFDVVPTNSMAVVFDQ